MGSTSVKSRRRLVVGNWKMHGSQASNSQLLTQLLQAWQPLAATDVSLCPPFVYIPQVAQALANTHISCGAQSLNPHTEGAYTGEVSAAMLADFGCRYVIVGHNERRRLCGESDAYVAEQFQTAQNSPLIPILCVGESRAQREAGQTLETIRRQLSVVIDAVGVAAFANAVVAYEPIWAVGTGKTATPEQAQEVHAYIRAQFGAQGNALTLLYGGSVKAHNAGELFAQHDIDGALLGGASLNAEEFLAICQSAEQA